MVNLAGAVLRQLVENLVRNVFHHICDDFPNRPVIRVWTERCWWWRDVMRRCGGAQRPHQKMLNALERAALHALLDKAFKFRPMDLDIHAAASFYLFQDKAFMRCRHPFQGASAVSAWPLDANAPEHIFHDLPDILQPSQTWKINHLSLNQLFPLHFLSHLKHPHATPKACPRPKQPASAANSAHQVATRCLRQRATASCAPWPVSYFSPPPASPKTPSSLPALPSPTRS
jgi:hypothetical protein